MAVVVSDCSFQEALAFTLSQEGLWSDNPADSGGSTMRGVTLTVFRAWRHDTGASATELRTISDAEAEAIYRCLYWNPIHGDALPAGVSLSMLDAAVQHGVRRAALFLQRVVDVAQDGVIGPVTLAATAKLPPGYVINRLAAGRAQFYRQIPSFATFGRGWLARNEACLAAALRAASASVDSVGPVFVTRVLPPVQVTHSVPLSPYLRTPEDDSADALNAAQLQLVKQRDAEDASHERRA